MGHCAAFYFLAAVSSTAAAAAVYTNIAVSKNRSSLRYMAHVLQPGQLRTLVTQLSRMIQNSLLFGFVVVPSPKKVAAYQLDAIANVMKT